MSFYIFLSKCVLARTNLLILILFLYSLAFWPAQLKYSFKPQHWVSVTLALADRYVAHSLWHCCRGAFSNLISYHLPLPPCILSSAPSSPLQVKMSYRCFKAHTGSPQTVCPYHIHEVVTDRCASTIHNRFHHQCLKFWSILVLFSPVRAHFCKDLPSCYTCPSSHPPLKLSSAVTP